MFEELSSYWRAYGGLPALLKSPFLWLAIVLAFVLKPWWITDDKWPDTALLILPPLLGFTIGAMAVVLAFPTSKIFKHLAEDGRADSYYAQLAAKLAHFIFIQTLAILITLIWKAYNCTIIAYIAIFFLLYAMLTAAAIALALVGMAMIYNSAGDQV